MGVNQYRALEVDGDWPFFDPDCSIPEDLRAQIWPLTEAASCKFWDTHVSAERQERHPALLPKGHWFAPTIQGPSWSTEQQGGTARSEGSRVESFLIDGFRLAPNERAYFILMREQIYSVPMALFARHWGDFLLLGDENPFLFHPDTKVFACFGPNGQLSLGRVGSDPTPAP